MPKWRSYLLLAIIAVSLLCAVWLLTQRVQAESYNRTVALAVDYQALQQLAELTGQDVPALLRRLKAVGATHAIVHEQIVQDLVLQDMLHRVRRDGEVELVPAPDIAPRVTSQITGRIPSAAETADGAIRCAQPDIVQSMLTMGVGYPEDAVADIRRAGLRVVVRPVTQMLVTKNQIDAAIDAAARTGAKVAVFAGKTVPGTPGLIEHAARRMKTQDITFGYIELAKQKGEAALAAALDYRIIRCHSITAAEMQKVSPQRAIDRYCLAVRERNVRLCYVRPRLTGHEDLANAAEEYVGRIAQALAGDGFRPGRPAPFLSVSVNPHALILVFIGVFAAGIWLLDIFFALPGPVFWILLVASALLSIAACLTVAGLAADTAALGAALLYPTLAMVRLRTPASSSRGPAFWPAVATFLVTCAISMVGAITVAGSLSDVPHMLGIDLFRGVKLALIAPVFITFLVFVARSTDAYDDRARPPDRRPEWPALHDGLKQAGHAIVRYWHVAIAVIALLAAGILITRSGNLAEIQPPQLELRMRTLLQHVLVVRPRFKEFLFGHPALIIATAMIAAGRIRTFWLLIVAGAIGQVSILNTFEHIHTPFVISLLRTVNGIALGILAAAVVWLLIPAISSWYRRLSGSGQEP